MKCKLCGRKATEYKKIRNGAVCQSCLNVMPVILSDNDDALKKLTDKQLKNTKRIITKPKNPYFGKIDGIKVGIDAMQINEWEIQYRHIKNIELNFHPKDYGTGNLHVKGDIGIKIETNHPHILFEDILAENQDIEYRIGGKDIHYIYPKNMSIMIGKIMNTINTHTYNMRAFYDEVQLQKQKKAEKENKETEFDKAKRMFGVEIPYTIGLLKTIRNQLVLENHPDQGGSAEKCAEINRYYDLLARFAKN